MASLETDLDEMDQIRRRADVVFDLKKNLDEILLGDEIKKLSIAGAGFKQSKVVLFV